MSTSAFPINPQLTSIAMMYRNPDYTFIADQVLPVIPVAQKFKYTKYDQEQGYTVPDTKVGRKSQPNEVDFGGTLIDSSTEDFALDDVVPNEDVEAWEKMDKPSQGGPVDPRILSTQYLKGLVDLDREVRVANIVFNPASYVAGNVVALAGGSKWSDFVNSNPLDALLAALDVPLLRPDGITFGQQVWTKVRQHPKLVQAVYGTAQNGGVITREQLAEKLEVKYIRVGSAFMNNGRKGQAASMQRAWGNFCALNFSGRDAAMAGQPTFGFTGQFGTEIAGVIPEPKIGLSGSQRVRVGRRVREVISDPSLGYLFTNVV
jgi:hypothetical protein